MTAKQKSQGTRAELREMILSGHFKPGTFLPSVRDLAEKLAMPKSTVHVILKMLHTEGLIQLQPNRRGALVLDTANRKKTLHKFFLRPSDFGYFAGRAEAAAILSGICTAAEKRYADIMLSFSDSDHVIDEINSLYRDDDIQGVVYMSCMDYELMVEPLEKLNIPYVVVNNVYGVNAVSCVQDFRELSRRAVRYLHKHGHRKIGILHGPTEEYLYKESLAGFRGAMAEEELELNPAWIIGQADFKKKAQYRERIMNMLESGDIPTAFYTVRDYRAKYLYECCEELGLNIPEDISVISYDNINWDEAAGKGLTTFQEPVFELGESAIDMLNSWITTGKKPENYIVEAALIERSSVKKI